MPLILISGIWALWLKQRTFPFLRQHLKSKLPFPSYPIFLLFIQLTSESRMKMNRPRNPTCTEFATGANGLCVEALRFDSSTYRFNLKLSLLGSWISMCPVKTNSIGHERRAFYAWFFSLLSLFKGLVPRTTGLDCKKKSFYCIKPKKEGLRSQLIGILRWGDQQIYDPRLLLSWYHLFLSLTHLIGSYLILLDPSSLMKLIVRSRAPRKVHQLFFQLQKKIKTSRSRPWANYWHWRERSNSCFRYLILVDQREADLEFWA
jgi:hypothetical protein